MTCTRDAEYVFFVLSLRVHWLFFRFFCKFVCWCLDLCCPTNTYPWKKGKKSYRIRLCQQIIHSTRTSNILSWQVSIALQVQNSNLIKITWKKLTKRGVKDFLQFPLLNDRYKFFSLRGWLYCIDLLLQTSVGLRNFGSFVVPFPSLWVRAGHAFIYSKIVVTSPSVANFSFLPLWVPWINLPKCQGSLQFS